MCKTRVLDVPEWPKTIENEEIDALARVLGCQKRAPRGSKNKNSCSRSSFWPLNGHFGGPRGAKKSTFTTCLSRIYKRPKNRSSRLRGGNRNAFYPPHLARGTSIIGRTPGHNLIISRSQRITSHDIKVSK